MQAAIPRLMVFANTPEQKRHEEIRENLKTKTSDKFMTSEDATH